MISILLIDDEPAFLELGTIYLQRFGDLSVATAGSVEEAIARLEKERFDAIVTDYTMPDVEETDFIRDLRDLYGDTPVIVLSGRPRDEIVAGCMHAGAVAVLQKGSNPAVQYGDLREAIVGHVRRSGHPEP